MYLVNVRTRFRFEARIYWKKLPEGRLFNCRVLRGSPFLAQSLSLTNNPNHVFAKNSEGTALDVSYGGNLPVGGSHNILY